MVSKPDVTPAHRWIAASVGIVLVASAANAEISPAREAALIALGRGCEAPIIRIPGRHGDFDVYVESPEARVALAAANATVMHQPMDALRVKTAMHLPGVRIWIAYTVEGVGSATSVDRITVRPANGAEIEPTDVRWRRLSLGIAPSHGIIEPLRARFPEFVFSALPTGPIQLVLHTNHGIQRYGVAEAARSTLIRVCN